jgi:transposase-like protein
MTAQPDTATLDPRERRAVEALLAGASHEAAAAAAGVSPRTLRRWVRLPRFAAALRAAQAQAFDEALGVLRASALDGVHALREVASDCEAPAAARVAAARALLEEGRKAIEVDEIEGRLAKLEEALARGRMVDMREATELLGRSFELMLRHVPNESREAAIDDFEEAVGVAGGQG